MKKLLFLIIISVCTINAQDKEPNPWEFVWGSSSTPRAFVLDSFQQTSFLTGFQWSGSTIMNNALGNNATATGSYSPAIGPVNQPINLLIQPKWYDNNYYSPGYFGSVMMQYEPTLPLTSLNFGNILRPADESNPIFGFTKRMGTILEDPSDDNYSRLILYKDSSYVDSTVLSKIYPQPNFKSYDWGEQGGQTDGYLGKKWYLVINLKRLNPDIDLIKDDNIVLKLRMPFKRWDNVSGFIKFNKVPINHQDSVEELHFIDPDSASAYPYIDSRGYAQLLEVDTVTTIEITRKMLPIITDPTENITIYAEFHTNGTELANRKFSSGFDENKIKEFDIEVEYLGGLDIAIDWVRVENFNAHILNRGEVDWIEPSDYNHPDGRGRRTYWPNDTPYDTSGHFDILLNEWVIDTTFYYSEIVDIYNTINSSLKHIKAKSNNWQDAKLFRLYFQDIEDANFYWWGALRYANKLTNEMFIASDVENYPELYEYYTKAPNRYFGMKISSYEQYLSNPFLRATQTDNQEWADSAYKIMGYKYGFRGEQWNDTLTSGYETFFTNSSRNLDPLIFNNIKSYSEINYIDHMRSSNSFQTEWELVLKNKFNNPIHSKFLYLNSPWYINLFIGTNFNIQKLNSTDRLNNSDSLVAYVNDVSTKTAENIRLFMNTNLILGAKGIFFDREEPKSLPENSLLGLGNGAIPVEYDNDDAYDFIENDTIGGDFVGGFSDVYNVWDYIVHDSISKYGLIPPERIYIGAKSIRLEMKKIIDWIRLNGNELIDLSLQATYSKGFKTFENWNPYEYKYWDESPLRRIVAVDDIKTRKIFEPKHTMIHNTNPDYEFRDSSFYDITLLQHKNQTQYDLYKNKNAVYLGIINRRTDPLIFRDSIDTGNLDSLRELMFFSSAEFDDKVRFGGVDLWGVNQDSTWWQDQWWKRLGVRELNIPFHIKPYGNGTYLLAEEIGLDSLDSLGWRFTEKYYHRIDTVLTYNDSLKAKLLPGQGKIVKINFVPYFFNDPTKDTIETNDSCYFCDIFNDFDLFEFNVVALPSEEEGCCYNVSFTYNGNCTFEDIPFRLIFEGSSGNTFVDSNPIEILKDSVGTNIKYKDIIMDLDSTTGVVNLGVFCISDSSNKYKISFLAGKDREAKFIGCDRELQFSVECDGLEEVKDCCDNLVVSDTSYLEEDDPYDMYCTKFSVNTGFDSDCIYGISIGEDVTKELYPIQSTPIDFTTGTGVELNICFSSYYVCFSTDSLNPQYRMKKLKFLGKDGTTVCEVEVPVWFPCTYVDLDDATSGGGGSTAKSSNQKPQDTKSFKSEMFDVMIWPNPTSGELNVEIQSKLETEVEIKVMDNIGSTLSDENGILLIKGRNEKSFNLSKYSTGVYYIQIQSKEGQIVLPVLLNK